MKIATQWAACALALAFVFSPSAFAADNPSGQGAAAKMQDAQGMAGYRDWTTAQMMAVQKALIAQGADIQASGHWNDATRSAIEAFQKKHGLKSTGFPNAATVKALGIKMPH